MVGHILLLCSPVMSLLAELASLSVRLSLNGNDPTDSSLVSSLLTLHIPLEGTAFSPVASVSALIFSEPHPSCPPHQWVTLGFYHLPRG